jgi:hypothetical protein
MLRWLIRRKLDSEEKKLGESVDYLRHIVDVSPAAFLRFASILPLANSRKTLPKEPWFVAQLVALQHEDCGTCLQIGVNLARQAGVESSLIRAVLEGDGHQLPNDLADVARFTKSILTASDDDDALRQSLRERYGERGLIEIAYAIAGSRIPPTVKRTLGYAKSCSLVPVAVR